MKITIPKNDDEAREVAEAHYLSGLALAGYVASQVDLEPTEATEEQEQPQPEGDSNE